MLKEMGHLQGVRVPGDSWPGLDNVLAGFENVLALDNELERRLEVLLPRDASDNPVHNTFQFKIQTRTQSSLHETKLLPRVVGTTLHDGDGLHDDLGTCVLRK